MYKKTKELDEILNFYETELCNRIFKYQIKQIMHNTQTKGALPLRGAPSFSLYIISLTDHPHRLSYHTHHPAIKPKNAYADLRINTHRHPGSLSYFLSKRQS